MGHPGSCTGEPDTKEYERRIHLHVSHSTEGKASSVSQNLLPSTLWSTLLPWDILLCPAEELMKGRKAATTGAMVGYSTAWEENILRCLISTVGKAILTKPINPWVSDGTDLIPPAADVPASLCAAVLWYSLLCCALLHFAPPRNTNSHNDAACSFVRSVV